MFFYFCLKSFDIKKTGYLQSNAGHLSPVESLLWSYRLVVNNLTPELLNSCGNWRKVWVTIQKQPLRGVLRKICSENMQQIYRRTPMPKCDFNKVALQLRHGFSPVNLLHIFRRSFIKNTSGGLLLTISAIKYLFILHRNIQKYKMVLQN